MVRKPFGVTDKLQVLAGRTHPSAFATIGTLYHPADSAKRRSILFFSVLANREFGCHIDWSFDPSGRDCLLNNPSLLCRCLISCLSASGEDEAQSCYQKIGRKTHRMSPAHQRASSQQSPDPAESAAPSQLKLWTCCSWDRKNMLGLGSCHLKANNTAIWGFRVSIAPPSYQWFANTEAKRSWQFEINFTVRPRTGIWICHVPA